MGRFLYCLNVGMHFLMGQALYATQDQISAQELQNLQHISDRYDTFLVDINNVLMKKNTPLPLSIECLKNLQNAGKKIILFSNAVYSIADLAKVILKKVGLDPEMPTLGAADALRNDLIGKFKGKNIYHLNMKDDQNIFKGLNINLVPDIKDAQLVVLTSSTTEDTIGNPLNALLQEVVDKKLTVLCLRPQESILAQRLQAIGGIVESYSKPDARIYQIIEEKYGINTVDKSRILTIGDTLETDIQGANNYGVDALLILNGDSGGVIQASGLSGEEYLKKSPIPRWYMAQLQW